MQIDNGETMNCLINNKNTKEMTEKCKTYVNHYQLVTLRNYHFSHNFNKFCKNDIQKYCVTSENNKYF